MRRLSWWILLATAACTTPKPAPDSGQDTFELGDPVDLLAAVDPKIGTGGTGYGVGCGYPGASVPFGLSTPSPDTSLASGAAFGAYHGGGYHADDTHIQGFSQLHLHGVGLTDYGLVALMPIDGMTPEATSEDGYRAAFSHEEAEASAGLYRVRLDDPGVTVSLSTDGFAGVHHLAFDSTVAAPTLLVDLGHAMDGARVLDAAVSLDPATGTASGSLHTDGPMAARDFTTWFALELSETPTSWGTWSSEGQPEDGATSAQATAADDGEDSVHVGLWFTFDQPEVIATVGISLTDAEGATTALAQSDGRDLDATEALAVAQWTDALAGVTVWGGTERDATVFASALYRSLQMPNRLSDPSGRYRGFDNTVHEGTHDYYSDLSLWDTYRTTHPLYTLLWPDAHADMLRSFARMVEQGGAIPRWPLATWDPGFMVGSPGHIVAAEAISKGVDPGPEDTTLLLENAVDVALGRLVPDYGGRPDPVEYGALGYWPSDDRGRLVAWQLEVALADHALAEVLDQQGILTEDSAELHRRADFWQNVYNPETGWMQGRSADGSWIPLVNEHGWDPVYTEGNARQYVWMVPHDPEGLFAAMGGDDTAVERLTEFFEEAAIDAEDDVIGLPEEWYWHGNEIDLHAPWMFAFAGRPDLTRTWVRWVLDTWYGTGADGLAGNDDGGTLSAWAVWAHLGLYPMAGTDRYVLGWPSFDRIELERPLDGPLTIERVGDGLADGAVVIIEADGAEVGEGYLTHDILAGTRTLRFIAE